MKIKSSLVPTVIDDLKKRESEKDAEYLHGADRVDITHVEQLRFKARKGTHEFVVDEPPERGGTDHGANPLAYFIGGAAACLSTQFLRVIIARSMNVDTFEMTAVGRFDRRLGGSFREITYDVRMTGKEDESAVRKLAERAELQCYAHNTLRKGGVNLVVSLTWNGRRLSN